MKKLTAIAGVLVTLLLSSFVTSLAQTQSREDLLKELETKHKEITELEKKFLAPAEEDQLQYAAFLREPNTGLIRLLPRERFDVAISNAQHKARTETPASFQRNSLAILPQASSGDVPSVNSDNSTSLADVPRLDAQTPRVRAAVLTRGGGAYYSFVRLTHDYNYGSDIELTKGQFRVGFAGADFGFLTNLGNIPLETLDLNVPAVAQLMTYAPPKRDPEARQEYRRFAQGAEIEGISVKSRMPVKVHSTYLLRSVNYGQSDVLVAFHVVRKDSDGSVVIVWKLLKKYSTPQLARN